MKIAIVYASVHHGNTKKLLDAIAAQCEIALVDASKVKEMDLNKYDAIGFASGIYYSKFHQAVLNFAAVNLPANKKIFLIYTYGAKRNYVRGFMDAFSSKNPELIGSYGCSGYDTFGPFKLVGGIAKGHPDEADIAGALNFVKGLMC